MMHSHGLRKPARCLVALTLLGTSVVGGCSKLRDVEKLNLANNDYAMPADFRLIRHASGDMLGSTVVCPEPVPDAITVVAGSIAAQANVASYGGGGLSGGFNEAAAPLFARSQAIQAARETVTAACWNYQNGLISKFGYQMAMAAYPDLLLGALAVEGITDRPLHLPGGVAAGSVGASTTGSSSSSEDGKSSDSANASAEVKGGDAKVSAGFAHPATRPAFDDKAIAAMKAFVGDLFDAEHIFTTACMLHLADVDRKKDDKAGEKAPSMPMEFDSKGNPTDNATPISRICARMAEAAITKMSPKTSKTDLTKDVEGLNKSVAEINKTLKAQKADIEAQVFQAVGKSYVEILGKGAAAKKN
jgi:hypothetical protein